MPAAVNTIPGMPPVTNPQNIYSETGGPDKLSPVVAHDLNRIYVPNLRGNSVWVIDPKTYKVVDKFPVGKSPQHVVPSWDLRTLWTTNNSEGNPSKGSLTPIDPVTGKPGKPVAVDDPYNMYFTPDGKSAIVVAEALRRLDFRDPHSMKLQFSISVPACWGINHAAFSADGRYALFTCEFSSNPAHEHEGKPGQNAVQPAVKPKKHGGMMAKIDMVNHKVMGMLEFSRGGMPQDVLAAPNGHKFYVADMDADGVFIVDGDNFTETSFIPTGPGAHGLYPSRDATLLYVANRGSHAVHGPKKSPGGVSVIDMTTDKVIKNWPVPGGGSPDMGNVSADGKTLWLSGRFDDVVYAIDTTTGKMTVIPVGMEPHGLAVWPQPGRYSIGHTGIMH